MQPAPDFLPTANLATLELRARLLALARRFFDGRRYFEVDTPLLSHDRVVDPHLEPFAVSGRGASLYLQTSPEFAMKRLLAAGAEAIYQLGHVFRADESGRLHNPEFTMLEWYRVGDTHEEQMWVVEELVEEVFREAQTYAGHRPMAEADVMSSERAPTGTSPMARRRAVRRPFLRTTYQKAFLRHAGCDPFALSAANLAACARERGVSAPESLPLDDRDGWLNLLLAELVEPHLGKEGPEFIYDYPPSQAALACIRPGDPAVAERFELYIDGIELCNGYHELTDASELRRRIEVESQRRIAAGHLPLPVSNRLLAAMDAGLPPCSGVALGFDRLVMLAVGVNSVAEVIPFPLDRA